MIPTPAQDKLKKSEPIAHPPPKTTKPARSLSLKRLNLNKINSETLAKNLPKKECFPGKLFVPQITTTNIINTERPRLNHTPSMPRIVNPNVLEGLDKPELHNEVAAQKKNILYIKVENEMKNQHGNGSRSARILYANPAQTTYGIVHSKEFYKKIYTNQAALLKPVHQRQNSLDLQKKRNSELNTPKLNKNKLQVLVKPGENNNTRRNVFDGLEESNTGDWGLNRRPASTARHHSPFDIKKEQDNYLVTLQTQQSFMRMKTEENFVRHRRLVSEADYEDLIDKKGMGRSENWRGAQVPRQRTLEIGFGFSHAERAKEYRKESSALAAEIYSEIENMSKKLYEKLQVKTNN